MTMLKDRLLQLKRSDAKSQSIPEGSIAVKLRDHHYRQCVQASDRHYLDEDWEICTVCEYEAFHRTFHQWEPPSGPQPGGSDECRWCVRGKWR